jgi:hypothetical protein
MPISASSSTNHPSERGQMADRHASTDRGGEALRYMMTTLSWTFDPALTTIDPKSPRRTAPNQMLALAPTVTSPITAAVGATPLGSRPDRERRCRGPANQRAVCQRLRRCG